MSGEDRGRTRAGRAKREGKSERGKRVLEVKISGEMGLKKK